MGDKSDAACANGPKPRFGMDGGKIKVSRARTGLYPTTMQSFIRQMEMKTEWSLKFAGSYVGLTGGIVSPGHVSRLREYTCPANYTVSMLRASVCFYVIFLSL